MPLETTIMVAPIPCNAALVQQSPSERKAERKSKQCSIKWLYTRAGEGTKLKGKNISGYNNILSIKNLRIV